MIVSTDWLQQHLSDSDLAIVDVRNVTNQPDAGRRLYQAGHIPGAVFLDMDTDLADRSDLSRGRHPLPDPVKFVKSLARVGIGKGTKVIAYDDAGGSSAARLWWMMRWMGVSDSAVLDGGITKWIAEGRPLPAGESRVSPVREPLAPEPDATMIVDMSGVARSQELGWLLLDARAPGRFRGEQEPIDARAGHIPGAVNAPWEQNLIASPAPTMKSQSDLLAHYRALGITDPQRVVCYCGSGVTACLDILGLELAGLRGARLYPGSWSEWIAHN